MILKYKRLVPEAGHPSYATPGSVGLDLRSAEEYSVALHSGDRIVIRTGITVEIPEGFEGQVRSRSGLAAKRGVVVLNSPGTIDSDYRGEIMVILSNLGRAPYSVQPGDKIAQLVIAPVVKVTMVPVDELDETERGTGGLGSTGR